MFAWRFFGKDGLIMKKKNTLTITQTSLMTALIAVTAQISLPIFAVPMTLQTFAVCLAGFFLGQYYGTVSVLIYLALGAVGMPVFAGWQGSLGTLAGPTGGFLVGFLPLVFLCGIPTKSKLLASILPYTGLFLCHLLGIFWFSYSMGNTLATAFLIVSAPYLFKDIISCFLAKILSKKLQYALYKEKL